MERVCRVARKRTKNPHHIMLKLKNKKDEEKNSKS